MSRRDVPEVVRWARAVATQHDDIGWTPVGDAANDALRRASEAQKARVNARQLRLSPNVPGLSLFKRAVVFLRTWHLISIPFAQRLIDISKAWEV